MSGLGGRWTDSEVSGMVSTGVTGRGESQSAFCNRISRGGFHCKELSQTAPCRFKGEGILDPTLVGVFNYNLIWPADWKKSGKMRSGRIHSRSANTFVYKKTLRF